VQETARRITILVGVPENLTVPGQVRLASAGAAVSESPTTTTARRVAHMGFMRPAL
jgi:hypothetical protein